MIKNHYRWFVVLILLILVFITYLDRVSISFAMPLIQSHFHINNTLVGVLLSMFGVGYLIGAIPGGYLASCYGCRGLLSFSTSLWAVCMVAAGLSPTLIMLLISRLILGISESPMFPLMTASLSRWLPTKNRSTAFSFSLVAVPLSLCLSSLIIPYLITQFSWRWTFFIIAAVTLLWVPLWRFVFTDLPATNRFVSEDELNVIQQGSVAVQRPSVDKSVWLRLLSHPALLTNYFAFFVFGYILYFMMTWLPSYLSEVDHLSLMNIGWFNTAPWALSVVTLVSIGRISDHLFSRYQSLRSSQTYVIILCQILSGLLLIPVVMIHSQWVSLLFITLSVASIMGSNTCYFVINITVARDYAGVAAGIMIFFFSLSGVIAPALTGWLVNATGLFTIPFLLMTVLCLLSACLLFFFQRFDGSFIKGLSMNE